MSRAQQKDTRQSKRLEKTEAGKVKQSATERLRSPRGFQSQTGNLESSDDIVHYTEEEWMAGRMGAYSGRQKL